MEKKNNEVVSVTESAPSLNPQMALYSALAAAQADALKVAKDSVNTYHRYKYTSTEAMLEETKAAMSQHGLALFCVSRAWGPHPALENALNLDTEWLLVHEQGGERLIRQSWPIVPERGRPLDKAVAGACTSALNYLLRDLLQIPRVNPEDEMDHAGRDHRRGGSSGGGGRPRPAPLPSRNQRGDVAAEGNVVELTPGQEHPSYSQDRVAFTKAINNLGYDLGKLSDWLESAGQPRPERSSQQERYDLYNQLQGGALVPPESTQLRKAS